MLNLCLKIYFLTNINLFAILKSNFTFIE